MNYSINTRGKIMLFDKPRIMGILNVNDDSFFEGSRVKSEKALLKKAENMITEGVDILDIGAQSTRPGAEEISLESEIKNAVFAVNTVKSKFPEAIVSIDTYRSEVLKAAYECGADICNDVSGGSLDENMFQTLSEIKIPYILMHMKGNPQTMKDLNKYEDMILEMIEYFKGKIQRLTSLGIHDIIIDPGFGFAKNIDQNFYLLRQLRAFELFERPLLVGISRKSMIFKSLGIEADGALNGTTALNMLALAQGANLLRVHDVKEAKETIELYLKYNSDSIY
ncbi:MAG: dihydropteroate synthase [Cytophagales bacterium]